MGLLLFWPAAAGNVYTDADTATGVAAGGVFRYNNWDGGTDGIALTQGSGGNTGGASGSYLETVSGSGDSIREFSNAQFVSSGLAVRIATRTTSTSNTLGWTANYENALEDFGSFDIFWTDQPSAIHTLVAWRDSGAVNQCTIRINANNTLGMLDSISGLASNGSVALQAGQWYRVAYHVTQNTVGTGLQLRLYDNKGTLLDTISRSQTGTNELNRIVWGTLTAATNFPAAAGFVYYDNWLWNQPTWVIDDGAPPLSDLYGHDDAAIVTGVAVPQVTSGGGTTSPSVRSVGAVSTPGSATPHAVPAPASVTVGDLLITVFEGQTGSAGVTATGWTQIFNDIQPGATPNTRLCVLARLADGSEGASVNFDVPAPLNHVSGQMVSIQDHSVSNVATDIVVGTRQNAATTGADETVTIPGITVTAGAMVVMVGSTAIDLSSTTEWASWTNSNLTSITEQMDFATTTGNGGGFGMATGISAGTAPGDSTVVLHTISDYQVVHFGIPGVTTGGVPGETAQFLDAGTVTGVGIPLTTDETYTGVTVYPPRPTVIFFQAGLTAQRRRAARVTNQRITATHGINTGPAGVIYTDAATVTGVAVPSAVEVFQYSGILSQVTVVYNNFSSRKMRGALFPNTIWIRGPTPATLTDAATVTGVAVPSATDTFTFGTHPATITTVYTTGSVQQALRVRRSVEAAQRGTQSLRGPTPTVYDDAATVTGVAVPSATDTFTYSGLMGRITRVYAEAANALKRRNYRVSGYSTATHGLTPVSFGDTATVTGVAVPSAVEVYTYGNPSRHITVISAALGNTRRRSRPDGWFFHTKHGLVIPTGFSDSAVVTGIAVINTDYVPPGDDEYPGGTFIGENAQFVDAGTATGVAVPSALESPDAKPGRHVHTFYTGVAHAVRLRRRHLDTRHKGFQTRRGPTPRTYTDAATVTGSAVPSAVETFTYGNPLRHIHVVSASPLTSRIRKRPNGAVISTHGAFTPFGDATTDSATVTGVGTAAAIENFEGVDAATVTGSGQPSGGEIEDTSDAATVTGVGLPSTTEEYFHADAAVVTGVGLPSATEQFSHDDAAVVTGVAVPSALEEYAESTAVTKAKTRTSEEVSYGAAPTSEEITNPGDVITTEIILPSNQAETSEIVAPPAGHALTEEDVISEGRARTDDTHG